MSENASPDKQYQLRYLDLFEKDLEQIVDYITHELDNPEAADNLIGAMDRVIANKTVTYDFARLMEGATEVSCSAFGRALADAMR